MVSRFKNTVEPIKNFKQDVKKAEQQETWAKRDFKLNEPEDFTHDAITKSNKKVEFKFCNRIGDEYEGGKCVKGTGNLFLETYSTFDKNKKGGVLRAAKDGIDYFCYVDSNNHYYYVFDSETLATFQETNSHKYETKMVPNSDPKTGKILYYTAGHVIPFKDVQHLILCKASAYAPYQLKKLLNGEAKKTVLEKKFNL